MKKKLLTYYRGLTGTGRMVLITAVAVLASVLTVSCASSRGSSYGGEVTGVGGTSFSEPTPYGMVLVDRARGRWARPKTTAYGASRPIRAA